jgi:hypothetical protein
MTPSSPLLAFADPQGYADVATLVQRGRIADPDAAVRLVVRGNRLGVFVGVLPGSGLFAQGAAVGHRACLLDAGPELDVVVAASSLTDRFARARTAERVLPVPPANTHAPWAGQMPLGGPWVLSSSVDLGLLHEAATQGIAEIAAAVPSGVGSAAVEAARDRVWSAPVADVTAAVGFTAYALGFFGPNPEGEAETWRCGRWVRVRLPHGQVLARVS